MGMAKDPDDKSIIQAMINLGHNLGRVIVAEGAEDKATTDSLTAMGCDFLQGYYFARPMSCLQTSEWLSKRLSKAGLAIQQEPQG